MDDLFASCIENNGMEKTWSEASVEIGQMPIEVTDGILDPDNPDVIEGSRSFTAHNDDEVDICCSLRNCR